MAGLLAVPAAAQEAGPTEAEAAALLAANDWRERLEGINAAYRLGIDQASPALRAAVIDAALAEFRGETTPPPGSEAILDYLNAVWDLRHPDAIPALIEGLDMGGENHLADFGALAFPAVIAAVADPDEHPSRVRNGLAALRFMLGDGVLSAEQIERTRAVVRERLSGPQQFSVAKSAARLALALGDPELRAAVERIADDRAFAEALVSPLLWPHTSSGERWTDEEHALNVNNVQDRARLFLDDPDADIGPTRRRGG